jgi:MFS family permease
VTEPNFETTLSVIFCIGSLLQCLAASINALIIGRAIGGLGVGALRYMALLFILCHIHIKLSYSMLSPLYMAEISPRDLRGSLVALEQLSIVLGVVVGFWIGFFTRNSALPEKPFLCSYINIRCTVQSSASWRIPLALQLFPGVLLSLGCFFLPPSPRLLVLRGKSDEALRSLARLRLRPVDDPALQVSSVV